MFFWLRVRQFFQPRRLERLTDLAARIDELLLGAKLTPDTRQLLEQQRNKLERTIRQLLA